MSSQEVWWLCQHAGSHSQSAIWTLHWLKGPVWFEWIQVQHISLSWRHQKRLKGISTNTLQCTGPVLASRNHLLKRKESPSAFFPGILDFYDNTKLEDVEQNKFSDRPPCQALRHTTWTPSSCLWPDSWMKEKSVKHSHLIKHHWLPKPA